MSNSNGFCRVKNVKLPKVFSIWLYFALNLKNKLTQNTSLTAKNRTNHEKLLNTYVTPCIIKHNRVSSAFLISITIAWCQCENSPHCQLVSRIKSPWAFGGIQSKQWLVKKSYTKWSAVNIKGLQESLHAFA